MRRDPDIHLDVFPDVYTPAEDTFLMLSALEIVKGEKALEMGCGSGYLSLHMAKAGASVTAVDVDPQAVRNTEENVRRNGSNVLVSQSDLFQNVNGSFDLIVFNPPYLRGEVKGREDLCWAGGRTGLEVTSEFLKGVREHLSLNGRVLLLISSDVDGDLWRRATEGWAQEELTSGAFFFERLTVLKLTL